MEIIRIDKDYFNSSLDYTVYTIGNFDGVHKGHQTLVKTTELIAHRFKCNWGIITFDPNTKEFFYKDYKFLTTLEQKLNLFSKFKVPRVVIIDFNLIYDLSCNKFINNFLLRKLKIKALVCGNNFKMGKDKTKIYEDNNRDSKIRNQVKVVNKYHPYSSISDLNQNKCKILTSNMEKLSVVSFSYSTDINIILPVYSISIESLNNLDISSTNIKILLREGKIKEANIFLGYNFTIKSKVIHGRKLGRTLGFPTINMSIPEYASLKYGIYATKTYLPSGEVKNSVSSFGIRPTINESYKNEILETHIFDYNGDLYNEIVGIEFFDYIRPEKKFSSIDELVAAIKTDIIEAKKIIEQVKAY